MKGANKQQRTQRKNKQQVQGHQDPEGDPKKHKAQDGPPTTTQTQPKSVATKRRIEHIDLEGILVLRSFSQSLHLSGSSSSHPSPHLHTPLLHRLARLSHQINSVSIYVAMQVSKTSVMAIKSYQYKAEVLVRDYLLADAFVPYTSVLGGIFLCKIAYDLTQMISSYYFKGYASLTKIQRIEWNNRGMSSVHAIFIAVSRHCIWFLDTAGMKRSTAYLVNGVVVFFAWLVARILLFIYLFYHIQAHYKQIEQMHTAGYFLVFMVPASLAVMNLMWFMKILKGLRKTLAKRQ
ncbi:hypothetical protein J5N97_014521 [Dioscorea zingiberensis]|uniref:TLC domain-containing protein n=1 Tax=Dioscorea zingiberensis TaxID=325984 RepID=A0A9D5CUX7_9LILI|nr:hypothetical protein J5N97_014521 [Dioscorea zingiberensis]